jgi:hypothetical protein
MHTKTLFILFALTLAACDQKDPILPATTCESKCARAPETGPCEAYIPRYYYDPIEKKCKEFIWGGCEGVVPFETLAECEACGCE